MRKKINHDLVNEMMHGERAALYGVLTERERAWLVKQGQKKKKNPLAHPQSQLEMDISVSAAQ